ncbi:acyltransferase family protein [Domibacillus epiphyticus]|uniref:Acyltransferase n=1 Tax=Domibacillus epiphyticus TaxID=1714355 RepID=A0A1V2A5H9_9BACI|nr:acyltransferase family protein [Domibacillus epiphyticus]OMP66197.1 acyltransferase [Domibacillus epiphyticus]
MKKRDFYFDNVRFVLTFLVVFGHLLRPYITDSPLNYALYMSIYLFHMPAFILVSGYFAKGIMRPGYIKKVAGKLLLPLIIFQIIYSFFYFWIEDKESITVSLLIPEWSLWFLLSLFFWNVLLFATIKWLKPAAAIVIAIIAGLLIGLIDESIDMLSIGRTFVFFPFFLIGYHLKKEWFAPLFTLPVRIVLLFTAIGLFLFFYQHTNIQIEWLFGSRSYEELQADPLSGIVWRSLIYIMNVVMIAFILSIVTHKRFFFTTWGQNTLYVYLLHGFFVQSSRHVDSLELPPSLFALFAAASILTFILSSPITASLFCPVLEQKRPGFLMKKGDRIT